MSTDVWVQVPLPAPVYTMQRLYKTSRDAPELIGIASTPITEKRQVTQPTYLAAPRRRNAVGLGRNICA